jgi:hypothetical protein
MRVSEAHRSLGALSLLAGLRQVIIMQELSGLARGVGALDPRKKAE